MSSDDQEKQAQAEREAVLAQGYEFRPVPSKYAPPVSEKAVRRFDTSLYPDDPFVRMLRGVPELPAAEPGEYCADCGPIEPGHHACPGRPGEHEW